MQSSAFLPILLSCKVSPYVPGAFCHASPKIPCPNCFEFCLKSSPWYRFTKVPPVPSACLVLLLIDNQRCFDDITELVSHVACPYERRWNLGLFLGRDFSAWFAPVFPHSPELSRKFFCPFSFTAFTHILKIKVGSCLAVEFKGRAFVFDYFYNRYILVLQDT